MAEPSAITYRAFLSYSHRDAAWGKWLHAALEGYRIDKDLAGRATAAGEVPKTLRPIFRDREDFSAGHSLNAQTLSALKAAQFLIVICSPHAAQSKYVNEEIRRFKAMGRAERVIPVIVDGEPGDTARECFPPALRFKIGPDGEISAEPEEPIAADARPQGDGKDVVKLKVVAGLIGVGLDEIVRRAERARRRRLRNWIAALASLSLIFAGLAVWAEINRREAVAQRLLADQRREQAERNFAVAHEVADSLAFTITKELRDVPGIRPEMMQKILANAGMAYERLVQSVGDNVALLRSQAGMYLEFGKTYADLGDTNRQLGAALTALEIMKRLTAADPGNTGWQRDLFVSYTKVGDALLKQDNSNEALTQYHNAIAIMEPLSKVEPNNATWQTDLAISYESVGGVLVAQGKLAEALTSFRASLAIRDRLVAAEPDNADLLWYLFESHQAVGDALVKQGNLSDALMSFRSGLTIAERLAKSSPNKVSIQQSLAISQEMMAKVLVQQRNLTTALALFRNSLMIRQRLSAADPDDANLQHDLSRSYLDIGKILVAQGSVAEALTTYRAGLAIAERLASVNPDNQQWQFDVVVLHFQLVALRDDVPRRLTDIVARLRKLNDQGRLSPDRAKLLQMAEESLMSLQAQPPSATQNPSSVTRQAPPSVMPQAGPSATPQHAPPVTSQPVSPVTSEDVSVMLSQAQRYWLGQGVPQDLAKSREWYEKAAAKGNVDAMVNLGFFYQNGLGVAQDNAKAREWYTKAADKGNAPAKAFLKQLPIR